MTNTDYRVVPVEPTEQMLAGLSGPAGYTSLPLIDAYRQMVERAPTPPPSPSQWRAIRVSAQTMRESNEKITHLVCIDRPDRPLDAKPWDAGRITPYSSEHRERVEFEVAAWQEMLQGCGMFLPTAPDAQAAEGEA